MLILNHAASQSPDNKENCFKLRVVLESTVSQILKFPKS